jgi:hypothetical protein
MRAGTAVLTTECKINLVAPAVGERIIAEISCIHHVHLFPPLAMSRRLGKATAIFLRLAQDSRTRCQNCRIYRRLAACRPSRCGLRTAMYSAKHPRAGHLKLYGIDDGMSRMMRLSRLWRQLDLGFRILLTSYLDKGADAGDDCLFRLSWPKRSRFRTAT